MATKTTKPATAEISTLSSTECQSRLDAIRARGQEIKERLALIRGPRPPQPAPPGSGGTGWTPPDPLEGAGPEYRAAVLAGTPEDLLELEREKELLSSESTQLAFRAEALQARMRKAKEEEFQAAAPGRAKRIVSRMDGLLDARDEARRALEEAERRVLEAVSELRKVRGAAGEDSPAMSPGQLRRLWTGPDGNVRAVVVPDAVSGGRVATASALRDVRELLARPRPNVLNRLLRGLGRPDAPGSADESEARHRRTAFDTERARIIAEGELEELEELSET